MSEPLTNMHTEPVAITGVIVSLIAAACTSTVPALVAHHYWLPAAVLTGLGVGASGIALTLGKRALTDSPSTKAQSVPTTTVDLSPSTVRALVNVATTDTPAPAGLTLAEQAEAALKSIENQP